MGESFEKRVLGPKKICILYYAQVFNFVEGAAFEKFSIFDLVFTYIREFAR